MKPSHVITNSIRDYQICTLNIIIFPLLRQIIEALRLNPCTSIQAKAAIHRVLSASSHFFAWFRIQLSSYLAFQTFSLATLISFCISLLSFTVIQSANLSTTFFLCGNPSISWLLLCIWSIRTDFLLTLLSVWRYSGIDYYSVPFLSTIYYSIRCFRWPARYSCLQFPGGSFTISYIATAVLHWYFSTMKIKMPTLRKKDATTPYFYWAIEQVPASSGSAVRQWWSFE